MNNKIVLFYSVYLLGFSLCGEIYAINDADECNENKYFNYNRLNESNCTLHLSTEADAVLRGCNFSRCKIKGPETIYLVGCNLNEIEFDSNITKVHLSGCSFNNLKFAPNTIIISDNSNAGHIDNVHLHSHPNIIINGNGSTVHYGYNYYKSNDYESTINYKLSESISPGIKLFMKLSFLGAALAYWLSKNSQKN